MLTHYLKIAFRNLTKYKMQTIINIIGLAVGFVCFALSALWIRYEMTFDNFHRDADRIYVIYSPAFIGDGLTRSTPFPLAAYLKANFPEVEEMMPIAPSWGGTTVTIENVTLSASVIRADTSLLRMFDVRIIQGNSDFLTHGSGRTAITQRKAKQLFGNENPIGRTISYRGQDFTINAVVSDMPRRSNYAFDLIMPFIAPQPGQEWNTSANTIIKLHRGIDLEAFRKRLYEHTIEASTWTRNLTIKPLTRMRILDPTIQREVRFQHILIFSLSGLLVILCSLFNYLTLFVTHFRMRQKEMALRKVCGASGRSLMAMLSVEFILTLLFAVLLGGALTLLVQRHFMELSDIQMNLSEIYRELLVYVGGMMMLSLLVFWLVVFILQHRSLNISIRQSNLKVSRKISVVVQLIISIGFAFCSLVILKQMHFLQHSDVLGFSFQNRGVITAWGADGNVLINRLRQVPEITKVVGGQTNLLPLRQMVQLMTDSWDNQPVDVEYVMMDRMEVSPECIEFWNFQLMEGELLTEASAYSYALLSENAVRAFGWYIADAVGRNFNVDQEFTVIGVVRNIYHFAPTVQVNPIFFAKNPRRGASPPLVLFQYHENSWDRVRERIEQAIIEEFGDTFSYRIFNSSEEYARFLRSESMLMRLLFFVSLICILICIFGFVSLVSLTCEERRKQIAIRKISGATVSDILAIFAKEYFLLLIIGAVIAFSGGYIIMQRWLEQYVKQTTIPVWVYLSILLVMASIIVLCVGWRVWKTSRENPADVLKSE